VLIKCPFEQLLEVTARAVHLVVEWGEIGIAVADGLSNLLKVSHQLVPVAELEAY
jgi:hypothetical protein